MAKQLYKMSWDEVQKEMSIAGDPEKLRNIGEDITRCINIRIDKKNRAELTNTELMLRRIIAEVRQSQRLYDKSHRPN